MNSKILFYQTLIISIIIQFITGALEIFSLFIKVPSQFTIIRQLLILEVTVQVIEGLFYLWLVLNFLFRSKNQYYHIRVHPKEMIF